MKKKTEINTSDYEYYIFPLNIFFSKEKKGLPFRTILRQELEKIHPSFDHATEYFTKLIIQKKRLCLMVLVINGAILLEYERKKIHTIKIEGTSFRLGKPLVLRLIAVVGFVLLALSLIALQSYKTQESFVIQTEQEIMRNREDENSKLTKQVEEEEKNNQSKNTFFSFDQLMAGLRTFSKEKNVNYESLIISKKSESGVSLEIKTQNAFPEDLQCFFTEEQREFMQTGKVLYTKNTPSFLASFTCTSGVLHGSADENIVLLRTLLLQIGGTLVYEDPLIHEIQASMPCEKVKDFFMNPALSEIDIPIEKIEIKNISKKEVHLVIQTTEEGISILNSKDYVSFLNTCFFYTQLKKIELPPKPIENKEKIIYTEIVGKILGEDGKTKVFYKGKDGKLVSEVLK